MRWSGLSASDCSERVETTKARRAFAVAVRPERLSSAVKTKNDHFGRQRQNCRYEYLVISIHSSFSCEKGEKVSIPSVTPPPADRRALQSSVITLAFEHDTHGLSFSMRFFAKP